MQKEVAWVDVQDALMRVDDLQELRELAAQSLFEISEELLHIVDNFR